MEFSSVYLLLTSIFLNIHDKFHSKKLLVFTLGAQLIWNYLLMNHLWISVMSVNEKEDKTSKEYQLHFSPHVFCTSEEIWASLIWIFIRIFISSNYCLMELLAVFKTCFVTASVCELSLSFRRNKLVERVMGIEPTP